VIPIIRWGEAIQQELSEGWSRVIQHDLTGKLDGHSWTVDFPVYIDCTYLNGKYDENGVARHGYAADAPFIDSPRDALDTTTRNASVSSQAYRLFEQDIATTTTRDPTVRLLYVVVSLLLQNVWRYLHYEYVATPPPRRASPLVVAVQGVRQYDSTSCVDGPRGASGCPRESAT